MSEASLMTTAEEALRRSAEQALERAIEASGGPTALGRELGISGPAISQWKICPHKRVLDVERVSGVPRGHIRPDLYPPDDTPSIQAPSLPAAPSPNSAGEAA